MRILADRHHAGLYESLALLFEDRLGWELYTPIGHDWWDEDYWRFGEAWGDDRLAVQYLQMNGWEPAGDHFTTTDSEFPERPIKGVTLKQFRSQPFGYVMATVQDNQYGFARLAREVGAKYLLGVGNTGQYIDWSLDPIVLNSSEMPLLGRGLNYRQEFDATGLFGFREPTATRVIASFVNCFPSIACYPVWDWYRHHLPEFAMRVYGIDGPDGNIKPASAIAERMAASGWAWHDKVHGDGFGHVIHSWAAIGRPLIGHASHYAGKLAEGLWVDGVTAIDLDQRSPEDNIALIRAINDDPQRHRAMCLAIRARFEELVDFAADAERIRALLA